MRVWYRQILRPRRGELLALSHLDPGTAAVTAPILELDGDTNLAPLLRALPPRTASISVDVGNLPDSPDPLRSPPLDLAEQLLDLGIVMVPVLRPDDSARRLAEHGMAARLHSGHAMLRLRPHRDATSPDEADRVTRRALGGANLAAERVDLVIDLAETACRAHADAVEERARRMVRWARTRPWCSISVASGAMPPNLDELPVDAPSAIGRLDARVWARLADLPLGPARWAQRRQVPRPLPYARRLPAVARRRCPVLLG